MAIKTDYRVIMEQLDPEEAVDALRRTHQQHCFAVERREPMVLISRMDLGYLIVLAALWAQEGR